MALMRLLEKEKQDAPTKQESLALMRNLLRTAFSSIVYLRNVFPENCFSDHTMTGINIKALMPRTKEAKLLIAWLEKGVFDALDKHYLRTIIFGIYKDPSKDSQLIESFNFNIGYPSNNITLDINSGKHVNAETSNNTKDDIKKATVTMVNKWEKMRHLTILSQTLEPLPSERFLTIKLLYYDDVTPPDYEPPFFKEASSREEEKMFFSTKPVKIKVGCVETPFHSLTLKVKTIVGLEEEEGEENHPFSDQKFDAEEETQIDEKEEYCRSKRDIFPLIKKVVGKSKVKSFADLSSQFPEVPSSLLKECIEEMKREGIIQNEEEEKEEYEEVYVRALKQIQYEEYVSNPKLRDMLRVSLKIATRITKQLADEHFVSEPIFARQRARKVYTEKVVEELRERGLLPPSAKKRKRNEDEMNEEEEEEGEGKDAALPSLKKQTFSTSKKQKVAPRSSVLKKCSNINDPLYQRY